MPTAYSYQWTTAFVTPAALSGLAITADNDAIALVATCNASVDAQHYEYLWESQIGDDPWTEVARTTVPSFTYYLVPLNTDVRIRVSDSNGSQYGPTTEAVGSLTYLRWAMSHASGNADFIQELRFVRPTVSKASPLDVTAIQPLSGVSGTLQLPIVVVGQYQGKRFRFQLQVQAADRFLVDVFEAAALEPQGQIALKDPKGPVFIVQLSDMTETDLGAGNELLEFSGIQVA